MTHFVAQSPRTAAVGSRRRSHDAPPQPLPTSDSNRRAAWPRRATAQRHTPATQGRPARTPAPRAVHAGSPRSAAPHSSSRCRAPGSPPCLANTQHKSTSSIASERGSTQMVETELDTQSSYTHTHTHTMVFAITNMSDILITIIHVCHLTLPSLKRGGMSNADMSSLLRHV